jgi:hypothetical protein
VPTSPKGIWLNQLLFANDSFFFFFKAMDQKWGRLTEIFDCYEQASGQRLNKDKTSIFFSQNTTQEVRDRMLNLVGVPASHWHVLGSTGSCKEIPE